MPEFVIKALKRYGYDFSQPLAHPPAAGYNRNMVQSNNLSL
jgi:hypothetical protein